MPWARLDDRYDDSPKIREAFRRSPAAVALHVFAVTHCNRHMTDGVIRRVVVDLWLYDSPLTGRQKQEALATLLELDLLERDSESEHYRVHDFLDWNVSRAEREEAIRNGKKGGRPKTPKPKPPLNPPPETPPKPQDSIEGLNQPLHSTPTPNQKVNTNAELRSAVIEVFAYWQERCSHSQAHPSDDRLSKIRARLKERQGFHRGDLHAAILDCRRAVDGAAVAAYVDDNGKRHDGIELIFRNNAKLEDFMGRCAPSPSSNVIPMNEKQARTERRLAAFERVANPGGVA